MQSEKRQEQENHDIKERENMYVVEIEMPEYTREDIQALFNDGYLVVTAKKERTDKEAALEEAVCGETGSEAVTGASTEEFKKAYYIGRNVSQDNIRAAFHNGVLKCMITKVEKGNAYGPVQIDIM